jgi:SWI/SNF-related matrix-associated actin-dependent regulator of chromatin subfamily A member 5
MVLPRRARGLRQKVDVCYNISDDDDDLLISEPTSPETPVRKETGTHSHSASKERLSAAGHLLRPQRSLNLSLKAYENGDKPRKRAGYEPPRKRDRGSSGPSSRAQIRSTIASETTANRHRFFVEKRDYFLPLLPENNFISKLVSKAGESSQPPSQIPGVIDLDSDSEAPQIVSAPMRELVPYELLQQPKG